MSEVTNPLQACNDIFFKPNGVFKAVNTHNNWSWLPFFIVTALSVVPAYLFINHVDFSWYQNVLIDTQYGDLSPAEKDQLRANMQKSAIQVFMLVGGILGPIVVNAVIALYLHLMTRSDENNLNGYTDWYGFTWWAGMPVVFSALLAVILIILADDTQLLPTVVSPLSLAYWANIPMSSPWFGFGQSLRLDGIWSIYLMAVGIAQWTQFPSKKSVIVATAPFAVIWIIWALVNIFS